MKYAVVDLAGDMDPTELANYAAAQERQLRVDYAAAYDGDGIDDEVRVATTAAPLEADERPINLHKTAPAGAGVGALAEHGLDSRGMSTCDVYRDLIEQAGDSWTSAASHEVLESKADPRLHRCVELDDGSIWDEEVCDRVESDDYAYPDGPGAGVLLSNFNTPQCFEPSHTPGEKYDHLGLSKVPNEIREGGYAQEFTPGEGWQQRGAMGAYRAELARRGLSRGAIRKARIAGAAA